jgi:tetratricopeptide (TPR) repeat protein
MNSDDRTSEILLPFEPFLDHLRRHGFSIGVEHHLRLRALLNRVGVDCEPWELPTLICPLFATSAEQQEFFYRAFDSFHPVLVADGRDATKIEEADQEVESEHNPTVLRRWLYITAGIVALLIVVAILTWKVPALLSTKVRPIVPPSQPTIANRAPTAAARRSSTQVNAISLPFLRDLPWYSRQRINLGSIAVMVPLVLWVALEVYRLRRRILIRKGQGRTPPYSWPVRAGLPPDIYAPQDLASVSRLLHRRYQGETETLDVGGTVEASVAAMGFPTLRYRKDSRLPEYLFLIDRVSFRDHQAHLHEHLAARLRQEGLYVSAFFYEGDPRICWNSTGDESLSLEQLQRTCAGYRLLIFGDGGQLLDAVSGRMAHWCRIFHTWPDRALLTHRSSSQWGIQEMTLATRFVVVPATLEGVAALAAYFELPFSLNAYTWRGGQAPPRDSVNVIDSLLAYLGFETFQWLCVCAIYPELHWDLTLRLGALPSMARGLICEENLVKLLRLEWFRSGSLPDDLRRELIGRLAPKVQGEVRASIVELLESNPPPSDTFAADAYQFQIAYQRNWASPKDHKVRRELKAAIENLSSDELLQDYAYLDAGQSVSNSALRLPLPSRLRKLLYPAGVARFGLKAEVRLALVVGLMLLVGIGLAVRPISELVPDHSSIVTRRPPGAAHLVVVKFVALLPLRVVGKDPALQYEAAGFTDALSAKLNQMEGVHLASSVAVEKINPADPVAKVARQLGAELIVQGTMQSAGDKIDAVFRLSDATGKALWTKDFRGVRQDLLNIEDQIYNELVTALELKPSDEELARNALRPTENVAAYDLYLQGRNILRGKPDVTRVQSAMNLYEQAIKKDASFALAYVGLADASLIMYKLNHDAVWSQKALSAAQHAQTLNDEIPEVHFALANVYNATGKSAEGILELKRALTLAPNSDDGYHLLGDAYMAAGKANDALQAYQQAIDASPYYSLNYNNLGMAYAQLGQNQKASDAFRRVVELAPDSALGYENLGIANFQAGKWNEAIVAFGKALKIEPSESLYSNMGAAYFYLGHRADAVTMFQKAVNLNPNDHAAVGNLADGYRWSEDKAKAKVTYEQAIALALKALRANPQNASTLGYLAYYYAKNGDAKKGLDFIHRARGIDPNDYELMYKEAVIDAIAGQQADALVSLKAALQKGYPVEQAKNDPELKLLETNPDFSKLLAQFVPR